MSKKIIIIICFLVIILLTGSLFSYQFLRNLGAVEPLFKVTSPKNPKFNPDNFAFSDYYKKDEAEIYRHIFPIGTDRDFVNRVLIEAGNANEIKPSNMLSLYYAPEVLEGFGRPAYKIIFKNNKLVNMQVPISLEYVFPNQPKKPEKIEVKKFTGAVNDKFQLIKKNKVGNTINSECPESLQLEINQRILLIPKKIVRILKFNGEKVSPMASTVRYPCEKFSNDVVEVDYIYFRKTEIGSYGGKGFKENFAFNLEISLQKPEHKSENKSSYELIVNKGWLENNVDLSAYPLKNGFFKKKGLTSHEDHNFLLISQEKDFDYQNDKPLVFTCFPSFSSLSKSEKCGTNTAPVNGVRYSFSNLNTNWVPIDDFKDFYKTFLTYIESFDVTDKYYKEIKQSK